MKLRTHVNSRGKKSQRNENVFGTLSAVIVKVCVLTLDPYDRIILLKHTRPQSSLTENSSGSLFFSS